LRFFGSCSILGVPGIIIVVLHLVEAYVLCIVALISHLLIACFFRLFLFGGGCWVVVDVFES
jgi:hypothetical protein